MNNRPLYCIVANKEQARLAAPDLNCYAPKELAAKEQVSDAIVYTWIHMGLPIMRRGKRGRIKIFYQDYVQWMIECAKDSDCKVTNVPVWAYWYIRYGNGILP